MSITLQKIAGAVLFALILVVGLNLLGNGLLPVHEAKTEKATAAKEGGGQPAGQEKAAAPAQPELPLPQRLAAADVQKGQGVAKKCQSCHNFEEAAGNKVGPNLHGVVGRPKASVGGFAYSDAFKKLAGNWTYEDLDKFLTKPGAFAAGTKMSFAGLPDGNERADVIAYLRSISSNAPPLPK